MEYYTDDFRGWESVSGKSRWKKRHNACVRKYLPILFSVCINPRREMYLKETEQKHGTILISGWMWDVHIFLI